MEQARILVVDDDPTVLEYVKEFLDARGYAVTTASSGVEALTAVQRERPHLVLLDIVMPGMSGLETLPRILEIDSTIAVIILTVVDDYEMVKKAIGKGAYDYITKPIKLDYLELSIVTRLAQTDLSLHGQPEQEIRGESLGSEGSTCTGHTGG